MIFLIYYLHVVIAVFDMGSMYQKREKVKMKNLLPRGVEFSHLNTRGEITLKRDRDFDILCFEINFQGYFLAVMRLLQSNHLTSPPTPNVSNIDNVSDSGVNCQQITFVLTVKRMIQAIACRCVQTKLKECGVIFTKNKSFMKTLKMCMLSPALTTHNLNIYL